MSTTVARLHKHLGELIAEGHGRKPVCVDKSTFGHPLEEDGAVILDVAHVGPVRWIGMADDDGGTKVNKDGTEAGRYVIIISGNDRESSHG